MHRGGGCEAENFASDLLRDVRPLLPVALLSLLHVRCCVDDCVLLADVVPFWFVFSSSDSFLKQSPLVHAIVKSLAVAKKTGY